MRSCEFKKNPDGRSGRNLVLAGGCLRLLCFLAQVASADACAFHTHELELLQLSPITGPFVEGPPRTPPFGVESKPWRGGAGVALSHGSSCSNGTWLRKLQLAECFACDGGDCSIASARQLADVCAWDGAPCSALDGAGGLLLLAARMWSKQWNENILLRCIWFLGGLSFLWDYLTFLWCCSSPKKIFKRNKRNKRNLNRLSKISGTNCRLKRETGFVARWKLFHVATAARFVGRKRVTKISSLTV